MVVGAVVGMILATHAATLRGDPPKKAQTDRIARLVKQLGDDAFAQREAASKELETIGAPALAALRKAVASSDDFEIRRRAERIVETIGEAAANAELDKLQGVWTMASYEVEGKQLPGRVKSLTMTITGRKWVAKWAKEDGGEHVESGIFTLVKSEKSPLAVDWVHLDGPHKGSTVHAICRVDHNTFKFCCCVRADDRPTDFATKTGDAERWLITYDRKKK